MSFSSTAPKPLTSRSFQILSDCIIYEFEKIFLKAEEGSRDYEKKDALQKEYDRFKSWVTGHAVSVDGAPSLQARVQKHEEKVIRKLGIEDGIHESLKSIITHLRICE